MSWFLVLSIAAAILADVPHPVPGEPTIEPPGASEPSEPPVAVAPPEPASGWYGAPALVIDGAVTVGMVAVIETTDSNASGASTAMFALTAAYLLGGPVVHLVHGKGVHAAESLGLRIGALAAGVAAVYVLASSSGCEREISERPDSCNRVGYGLVLSPILGMILDDLLLAREPVTEPRPALSTRLLVQPGLAMFGVGGTF